jgi:dipeptidyl aminopeptidase/acylaminoacyl peptidase
MSPSEYLDALLGLPGLAGPAVSRDGRWVAWTWFRVGPVADVYVAPTDGSAAPTRLTAGEENSLLVGWTPDSRATLVAQDRGGDERSRLYRVALDRPLDPQLLTDDEPRYFLRGGALHPNGKWLVYGANADFASGEEIEPTWVYRHNLETGERRPLARPLRAGGGRPILSPDGARVLYLRKDRHPAGHQFWLVDIEGRDDREILNFGDDVKCAASWFPDGRRILVTADTPTHVRVGVLSLPQGDAVPAELPPIRWLLDDPARSVERAFVPFGSNRIVLIDVQGARGRPSLLDPETGTEEALPAVPGNLVPLAPLGGGEWVALYSSSQQPADVIRFSLADPRPDRFVSLSRVWERTPLRRDDFTPAEDFRWQSVDGLDIQGWLYRPPGEARGLIVYVHGGPTAHSLDQINGQIQFFARAGFVVLDPNYRGSTGFGLAFREAIKADGWGGREQDDIRTGIEALLAAGIAQPGRVGITGTSYGGYSSWCAITRWNPEILAAAAPICGMTDLVVDYQTTRPDLRPYSEEMLGGSPEQAPDRYYERSPINFVRDVRGALLIVQGARDPNVTPENVRAVRAALDAAGVDYDVLEFADEGHGIARPANQRILYERLADFFARSFSE